MKEQVINANVLVSFTGEQFPAHQRADVVDVDAAGLVALVSATATLLRTPLVAPRIVPPCLELGARHLLVHESTAALDLRRLRAGRAGALVAVGLALVAAIEPPGAGEAAAGNGIETGAAGFDPVAVVELLEACLAAVAAGDEFGGQLAGLAGAGVAGSLAGVIATVEQARAGRAALEGGHADRVQGAWNRPLRFAAMTGCK